MASNPKSLCQVCRMAQHLNEVIKKNIKLYAFFAILIIEFLSVFLQDVVSSERYLLFWYPLLFNLVCFTLFVGINYHANKLRFCIRQKIIVISLASYYFINALFVVFPTCWTNYQQLIGISILSIVLLLFIMSWKKTN